MISTILLEHPVFDQSGVLNLRLDRQISVRISASEAQKRVTRFVHWEISSQMHGEEPALIVGDEIRWRVPVHLTMPSFGDVGCVGYLFVDATTGMVDTAPGLLKPLLQKAEELALRFTPLALY